MMDDETQRKVFNESLAALKAGQGEDATRGFRSLLKAGSQNPRHVSYCGLSLATVEGKLNDARTLCEYAVRAAPYDPEMHLNLALVYERGGWRTRAIQELLAGLTIDTRDVRLRREYIRLNRRGKPALRFLPRQHPLNRRLGKLRSRIRMFLHGNRVYI